MSLTQLTARRTLRSGSERVACGENLSAEVLSRCANAYFFARNSGCRSALSHSRDCAHAFVSASRGRAEATHPRPPRL